MEIMGFSSSNWHYDSLAQMSLLILTGFSDKQCVPLASCLKKIFIVLTFTHCVQTGETCINFTIIETFTGNVKLAVPGREQQVEWW